MSSFIIHITFDCADAERLADFWAEVTGYHRVDIDAEKGVVALEAPDRRGVRRLLFFPVPEPKTSKNRVHVDLAARDPHAEIERLRSLGATVVEHRRGGDRAWTFMLDPEGKEFCIG